MLQRDARASGLFLLGAVPAMRWWRYRLENDEIVARDRTHVKDHHHHFLVEKKYTKRWNSFSKATQAHIHTPQSRGLEIIFREMCGRRKETGVLIAVKCETWTRKNVARINFNLATYVNFQFRQASLRNVARWARTEFEVFNLCATTTKTLPPPFFFRWGEIRPALIYWLPLICSRAMLWEKKRKTKDHWGTGTISLK